MKLKGSPLANITSLNLSLHPTSCLNKGFLSQYLCLQSWFLPRAQMHASPVEASRHTKTNILNSTHWSLRKSLTPKIDNMSNLGYPSKKSQKLRYFERKEVILAFTRDPHTTAAMSKWCETETNSSVHCGRSTHATCFPPIPAKKTGKAKKERNEKKTRASAIIAWRVEMWHA